MIILDTHVLVWLMEGTEKLGKKTREFLDDALRGDAIVVSSISYWEVAMLAKKKKLSLSRSILSWRKAIEEIGIEEKQLSGELLTSSVELKDFHSDPADRFIVATALMHGATLVTADQAILNWKHPLNRVDALK